jgi:hypothetical protein
MNRRRGVHTYACCCTERKKAGCSLVNMARLVSGWYIICNRSEQDCFPWCSVLPRWRTWHTAHDFGKNNILSIGRLHRFNEIKRSTVSAVDAESAPPSCSEIPSVTAMRMRSMHGHARGTSLSKRNGEYFIKKQRRWPANSFKVSCKQREAKLYRCMSREYKADTWKWIQMDKNKTKTESKLWMAWIWRPVNGCREKTLKGLPKAPESGLAEAHSHMSEMMRSLFKKAKAMTSE